MAIAPELSETGSPIPPPGTYEYFLYFSQSNFQPPPSRADLPDFLLEKQFPQALLGFLVENKTVTAELPQPKRPLIGFNSREFVTAPFLPASMLDVHLHLIEDESRLTVSRRYGQKSVYGLTFMPGTLLPLDIVASVGEGNRVNNSPQILKVTERIARDLAFVLRPVVLAKSTEDSVK